MEHCNNLRRTTQAENIRNPLLNAPSTLFLYKNICPCIFSIGASPCRIYVLSLFIFAKCVMQGGDITSDITGQFHDLVLRVQYLHGLCVGVVANRKRPGNLGSKFPRSENFERRTTSTTTTITTRGTLSKDDDDCSRR